MHIPMRFTTLAMLWYSYMDTISAQSESSPRIQFQKRVWKKEEYPNPSIDTMSCRSKYGLLCDPDSILSPQEIQELEYKVRSFQNYSYTIQGTNDIHFTVYTAFIQKIDFPDTIKNDNDDPNTATFQVAEEFARHIYKRWIPSRTNQLPKTNNTSSTNEVHQPINNWSFVVLIAVEDRMVYIARPTTYKNHDDTHSFTSRNMIDSILTSTRIERILKQHMMPYLQQKQYIDAIDELISGIHFFVLYGPPKFWENTITRIMISTNNRNDFRYELCVLLAMICIWITTLWFYWCPILRLYEQWIYNTNVTEWWLARIVLRRYIFSKMIQNQQQYSKLSKDDMLHAQQIRQQYHVQSSCPICLEQFQSSSKTSDNVYDIGSDQQPITLLRCGHVYDTTCWTQWIVYHEERNYTIFHNSNNHNQNRTIKCLICQQPVTLKT